MLRSAVSWL